MTLTDRLTTLDPARQLNTTPPDGLLARLLAEPRPAPAPPRLRARPAVRGALVLGATAAVAAGISVGSGDGGVPNLTAQAYAQTDPAGAVLHVVLSETQKSSGVTDLPSGSTRNWEIWRFGKEVHTKLTSRQGGKLFTYDTLLGPRTGSGVRTLIDGKMEKVERAPQLEAALRTDPVAKFRARYTRGVLDDAGGAVFRGRSARRYVVDDAQRDAQQKGFGPRGPGKYALEAREEYFLDAETGAPLGAVFTATPSRLEFKNGKLVPGKPGGTIRVAQVFERVERLPATPENLAKVRSR